MGNFGSKCNVSLYYGRSVKHNPQVYKDLTYIQKPCTNAAKQAFLPLSFDKEIEVNAAKQSLDLFVPSLCMKGSNSHAVIFALDSNPRVLSSHALNHTISDSSLSHSICQLNQALAFFKPTKLIKPYIKNIRLNYLKTDFKDLTSND